MTLIAQLLPPENVLTDVDAASKKALFEQAGGLFEAHQGLERAVVFQALLERERLGSTGLGQGVAIPHGRIKGLKKPLAAFIRLRNAIPFDAPDDKAVSLVCVLLVPEAATEEHLQLLSELAQMFSDAEFRQHLAKAADAAAIHRRFEQWLVS